MKYKIILIQQILILVMKQGRWMYILFMMKNIIIFQSNIMKKGHSGVNQTSIKLKREYLKIKIINLYWFVR
jgi:hypothetical protein